jgi:hypothetical protein
METNNLSSFYVVLVLVFLGLVGSLLPLLKKRKLKPIPLTDDEIVALFPPKSAYTRDAFACDVLYKQQNIECDIVSLAERLTNLVRQGRLVTKEEFSHSTIRNEGFFGQEAEMVTLYKRPD